MDEQPTGRVYATAEQLAQTWRPLTTAEEAVAESLLQYASAMLRNRVPHLDERIDDGELDPMLVRLAAIWVVRRVMSNPDSARQRSITAGPFTHSITVDSALSAGSLYISDDDLDLFLPSSPKAAKIGTARLRSPLQNWATR